MVRKTNTQIKAHLYDASDPISVIGLLAAFNPACDINRVYEEGAMNILPFSVKITLASAWNSRRLVVTGIAPVAASIQSAEPLRQKKLFWSYPGVDNYLLKEFANDQAIAAMNSAILR